MAGRILCVAIFSLVVGTTGCNWLESIRKPEAPANSGGKLQARQSKDFIDFLNRQSGYVTSVRYENVSMSSTVPGQFVPRLPSGQLVCSKPRNFRMQAGLAVGGDQIDVGSNPEEFWMFVKQSDPKYIYCSHADFPKVQDKLPVPFEPDWVLQALGMTTFPSHRNYRIEASERDRAYYLSWEDTTASGQRLLKVIEFAGDRATSQTPQVRRHLILTPTAPSPASSRESNGAKLTSNPTGSWETVAIADIKQVQTKAVGTDPVTRQAVYVQVPTQVVLEWPVMKVKMELTLGRVTINEPMTPEEKGNLFDKPQRLDNANPVNLSDLRFNAPQSGSRDLPPSVNDRTHRR